MTTDQGAGGEWRSRAERQTRATGRREETKRRSLVEKFSNQFQFVYLSFFDTVIGAQSQINPDPSLSGRGWRCEKGKVRTFVDVLLIFQSFTSCG